MTRKEIEPAVTSLPPTLTVTSMPDEKTALQIDSVLAEYQPELYSEIHAIPSKLLSEIIASAELTVDENEMITLTKTQLRGCLAAAAIRSSVTTVMAVGTNLSDAHQLESLLSSNNTAPE